MEVLTTVQKIMLLFVVLILSGTIFITHSPLTYASWNNPYNAEPEEDNILYVAFSSRPKHLDPVRSYSEDEYQYLGQIYEPPLQYHYLQRPYTLEPQTLTKMPEIVYLDKSGTPLVEPINHDQIAYTEYHFELQKGILYQPHPALAKDQQGNYYYHSLTKDESKPFKSLEHFPHTGTRELLAQDYVNQIKRIANPALHSPIRGLMQEYIVGLKELAQTLDERTKSSGKINDLRNFLVEGVKSTGDYQFSIRLNGKYPQFLYWLAMPFFAPIPWEADVFYNQPGFDKNNISLHWYPIGTGAYMLTENNPNLRMVLEKNPNFRTQRYPSTGEPGDKEKGLLRDAEKTIPFIDKVVFTLEKESIPYWNKFLQGYFDSSGISSDSFDNAISFGSAGEINLTNDMKSRGIQLNTVVGTSTFYLGFNMHDATIGGPSERARLLRQAISIAVDYDEYISIFTNGRGISGQGPIPPGIFGYKNGEAGINPYVYEWDNGKAKRKSIKYAKQLLEQAGYKNGIDNQTSKPLSLFYESIDIGPDGKARLNWLRKQFEKIDIQLIIRSTDYNRFQEKLLTGAAQLFNFGWNADYPDPENFLFLFYGPQGKIKYSGENAANYDNPEYNHLFDQMKSMSNSPARQKIIDQMVEILRHDAPWVFGFHPKTFSLQHSWYKNIKPFIMTNTGTIKYKRIDKKQRYEKRQQWNQPIVWPVVLILLCIIALVIPAIIAYRHRERSRLL
ncbi:peptide ABC transporter substrate-binding protein [Candidatus Endobugula sertula]|uniref:Peptide ABC transporter substrate-binding protein n=1 Tax=Candidatus Endobugula sertula TaxID=62101 RepID=A0A1D2QT14_9GAMM|nr:peptide ABC transporter substrate-binding protein [Candidatus Endobugula sertula]